MGDSGAQTTETTAEVNEPVVEASDLSKSYGGVDVLQDVSFSLPKNAVTAIVGPNGSGKTTLVELITGLETQTSGTVTLNTTGERSVGYLPQDPRFQPSATVWETIWFYGRLLEDDPDVDAALSRVGLAEAADRRTDALSGGMRRLLGIAVCLLGTPPVLVLDEPTSGLDPEMTHHVHDVIWSVTGRDQSVILTTHDLSRASDADYVLVLSDGNVVGVGPPGSLLAETGTESMADAFDSLVQGRTVTPTAGDRHE